MIGIRKYPSLFSLNLPEVFVVWNAKIEIQNIETLQWKCFRNTIARRDTQELEFVRFDLSYRAGYHWIYRSRFCDTFLFDCRTLTSSYFTSETTRLRIDWYPQLLKIMDFVVQQIYFSTKFVHFLSKKRY